MRTIDRCLICRDSPPLRSEPCEGCKAWYCSCHADTESHICAPFHGVWRAFVGALEDGGLFEYRSLRPIRVRLSGDGWLDYIPTGKLIRAPRGVHALVEMVEAAVGIAEHSQQAADVIARVLRLEPLRAAFVDVTIHAPDGTVRAWSPLVYVASMTQPAGSN